jgi:hypothetical protein
VTAVLTDGPGSSMTSKVLTVTLTDAPTGRIVFELVSSDGAPSDSVRFTASLSGCEYTANTATCDVTAGTQDLIFEVDVPPGQVDKTDVKITFKDADRLAGRWNPGLPSWPLGGSTESDASPKTSGSDANGAAGDNGAAAANGSAQSD